MRRLAEEQKGDYADYKIEHVTGLEGRHAETKIVGNGKTFDYIGGTRRPCLCCTLYFIYKGIHQSKFNPHSGAYWNSEGALLSLSDLNEAQQEHVTQVAEEHADELEKHYVNEGLEGREVYDVDTDSETEEEVVVTVKHRRKVRRK